MSKTNTIYSELLYKKRTGIISNELQPNDILRLVEKINNSIFDEYECCNYQTSSKRYKCFSYNQKKVNLLRLLYNNYIGHLAHNEYLVQKCKNINCINLLSPEVAEFHTLEQ